MVKGAFDFLGLNYYTTQYVYATPKSSVTGYFQDSQAITSNTTVGPQIGKWIAIYPSGLEELLLYIKTKYNHPQPIYITENGLDVYGSLPLEQALADNDRVIYISRHLYYVQKVITNGVNVQGYFAWSLLDNFEWSWGFQDHYGIFYVDFQNGLQRIPKDSARWFKNFLSK